MDFELHLLVKLGRVRVLGSLPLAEYNLFHKYIDQAYGLNREATRIEPCIISRVTVMAFIARC